MRLLLAEDEEDLSKALVAVLKYNNYSVDAVYDGEEDFSGDFVCLEKMTQVSDSHIR